MESNTLLQSEINYKAAMAKANRDFWTSMQYVGLGFVTVLAMVNIWF